SKRYLFQGLVHCAFRYLQQINFKLYLSMKKLNAYLLVVLLSVIGFACKEDPLESITIKTSGKLSITLLNGNQPVANQKVWFESAVSGFEDVFFTDANGKIDFEALNAGPYVLY